MSDLLNNLSSYSPFLVPIVFLVFGITSSLHCVGMCGPLSMLAASGAKGSWFYQVGRLTGYLTLGAILSFLGRETLNLLLPKIGMWSWYLILCTAIVTLIAAFSNKVKHSLSKLFDRVSRKFMSSALKQKNKSLKAFAIGVSSVLLPCGVLYLAMISLVALSSPILTLNGILFFWAGTLPLLHFGLPQLQKFLERFSVKLSHVNAAVIFILCVLVLSSRYPQILESMPHRCH